MIGKLKSTEEGSQSWSQIDLDVNFSSATYQSVKWGEFKIPHRIMVMIQ